MQDRIIELLGSGVSASQCAVACGVTESYISQLLSDDRISARVSELRATTFAAYASRDKRIEEAEDMVMDKMIGLIPMITKPLEAARVFQTLNSAKKKTDPSSVAPTNTSQIVNINLPAAAQVAFKLSSDKQVVEIEGRSMATMPAQGMANRLDAMREKTKLLLNASKEQTPLTASPLLDRL